MKKSPVIVTLLLLALAIPTFALAQPGQGQGRSGSGYYGWHHLGLAPEKAEIYGTIMEEHFAKTYPLREEMRMKRMELEYMSRLETAEPDDIRKLVNDVRGIEQQMTKALEATAVRLQNEAGIDAGAALAGMHRGYRGGGYGPGGCPGWGDRDDGNYGHRGWDGHRRHWGR